MHRARQAAIFQNAAGEGREFVWANGGTGVQVIASPHNENHVVADGELIQTLWQICQRMDGVPGRHEDGLAYGG